ncbi:hypothetical protein SK3146_04496 [Paenibacillus konkukensis]|uniref:Uncharacterized protein n=1 Tax=Paenibacillus konkukensis TaxID=2020716 RepID=A0ABY4RUN9_9BACL|nr:hypothetical protein [Paenibacillus konkukensis]UQZ85213.1 hypothetical protein SK3146_04496 [Paenibacillus konkukensis]
MNNIFLTSFFLLMVISLLFDLRKLRSQSTPLKGLYYTIYAASACIYICYLLGYPIPMPTSFFIHKVSPWVFSLISRN